MILQVNQVMSNSCNQFEVVENDQVIFKGSAPFFKPDVPFVGGSVFRELRLTDVNGNLLLYTDYDEAANTAESAVPLKWLFTHSKQVRRYSIVNSADETIGEFYYEQVGVWDTRLVIRFGDRVVIGYKKEIGKKEVVSFYENDVQIGQLTKPNCVFDNLDRYFLHFSSDTLRREVIGLFVIYYDFMYHSNSGSIHIGWDAHTTYTYDKNNDKYNKDYIKEQFGEEENERVEKFISDTYDARKNYKF